MLAKLWIPAFAGMRVQPCFQRQLHRLLSLRRQIQRLGQHQVLVRFLDRRGWRRQAERHAVEPRRRSRPPSGRAIRRAPCRRADRSRGNRRAGCLSGCVAFALRLAHRQHHVAMRVVDGEHALGAGDADLERIDRARPCHRQRPRDIEMIDRAVAHHDHAGGGVDALVERAQHLVDRARVAFDRRFLFEVPHAHVERVRAGDHHRRDRRGIVGALVIVDRDQPVHEGARCHERDIPERAGAHLLLAGEPFAAEALGVADDRVDPGILDDLEHARRLRQVGRERLLDQQRNAALGGGEDRLDMQVLVGRDDGAGDFGALEQLDVALRDEIGADLRRDFAGAVRVLLGEPDPFTAG